MGILSPTLSRYPSTLHGGEGTVPPVIGGGDDGQGGVGGSPNYGERLRRARLGLAIALVAVTMMFVACTSALIMRKGLPILDPETTRSSTDWLPVSLPMTLLLVNTTVLLISSGTIEFARRSITRQAALAPVKSIPGISLGDEKSFPWLGLTVGLGLCFLFGQWMAWQELAARGFFVATSPSSSFFYVLTAGHALHLFGGVIALLYAGVTALLRRPIESRRIVVDVTAWYWHFMALLWIYVFVLLVVAR